MLTKYFDGKSVLGAQIEEAPSGDLSLVVVIPAMNEAGLIHSLISLDECQKPTVSVEVIVVINHPEGVAAQIVEANKRIWIQAKDWADRHSTDALRYHVLYHPDLSAKKGGVGMARKIGMDEAARRLLVAGNGEGVIACYDADCLCDPGYLNAIIDFFMLYPDVEGGSIYFEHPLNGLEKSELDAIVYYELHLRYFINAQRWAQFPYAYQTVGSSMAVRASTYIKVGGMNMRKAGEDFYFLHKVIERGAHSELNTTAVLPSARSSDRVPFGTGKAVADQLKRRDQTTYNPRCFEDLRMFFTSVPEFYTSAETDVVMNDLPVSMREFLMTQKFNDVLKEIKSNTASATSFEKRFYRWFNAFRLMKYVHYARDNFFPDVEIDVAAEWLFEQLKIDPVGDLESRLIQLRKFDKKT